MYGIANCISIVCKQYVGVLANKDCNKYIANDEAWQRVQCYIDIK